jgi:penicillin-binding protein 1C
MPAEGDPHPNPPPQGEREPCVATPHSPRSASPTETLAPIVPSPLAGEGQGGGLPGAASRRPRLWPWIAATVIISAATFASVHIAATIGAIESRLPPPPHASQLEVSTVVLDRNGKLLRPFAIADGRWRLPVRKEDVDPRFVAMLMAYEDKRFYEHSGVDFRAMARSAAQFVRNGRVTSGGSTLTMQVARLLEGAPTRTVDAKIRQIVHARALERSLGKDEILTLYLTLAPYGGNIEGIRAATLAYFGKEPARLTTAEIALLVALPQSPEARRPDRSVAAARRARDRVLDRLVAAGALDAIEAAAARTEGVPAARRPFPMLAPHLASEAVAALPAETVHRMTVDRDVQAALERLVADRVRGLGPKLSAAIIVADHASGEIIASVGSPGLLDPERGGAVDMTMAMRSPGSTLKPLIYGLAFEDGLAHPESLIEDRPTAFSGYVPVNFDGSSHGTVTIREALQLSLNIPAVVVLDAVGPARLVARMQRAGMQPLLPEMSAPGLAVGLGGIGVTLRDLTRLYAAIARGGAAVALSDRIDSRPALPAASPVVLDTVAAWYVEDILAGMPPPVNGSPGRVAYKTGTSYGYRDAWSVGFDGRYVVGVWVGRPDGSPVPGLSGATAAAPLLFDAFDRVSRKATPLPQPPAGAIVNVSTARLPVPLRRFRHPDETMVAKDPSPEIAFPRDGVRVDVGFADRDPLPLVIKVRNGVGPFTFLANGKPIGRSAFERSESWTPDGPGYVTLSVIDAAGRSDRVTVFLE